MRLKLSLFSVFISMYSWSQTTDTFTTSGTFTVPAGITSITAKAWGGGGSGGGASGAGLLAGRGAAGGGGGAYVSSVLTVTPGAVLSVVVAGQTSGTTGANGTAGGNSTITGFEASFLAVGGSGGGANNTGTAPGATAGGTVAASAGTIKIAGVAGGAGNSALLSLGLFSGAGGAGGNSGGAGGGANSSLILGTAPGNIGTAPGGGGSGAINSALGVAQIGGTGGAGEVSIIYTCPTYNITGTSATNVCVPATTSTVTLTSSALLLPVGNYTVTYDRSSPSATGLTGSMTVSTAGTGTFVATGLTTAGSSTISVTGIASGTCSSSFSANNTVTITVSPATVGGTVNGGTTICSGNTSGLLTLSGHTGSVVKWQYAVSPFSSWNDITNTSTTYTSGALTATTQFRAVVQSGACSSATSAVTTVTVNALPTITLAASATNVCFNASTQNTTLAYSATTGTPTTYSVVWNTSPSNSFTAITNASLSASPLTIAVPAGTAGGTYTGTLTVKNANGCVSAGSVFTITINASPAITTTGTVASVCTSTSSQNATLVYTATGGAPTGYSIDWSATANANLLADQLNTSFAFSQTGGSINTIVVPANALAGTYSGVMTITNGNCNTTQAVSITINTTPTAPIIGLITPPTCTVPFGSVALSSLPSGNWTIITNPVTVTTSGSGTSTVITNLAPNTYTFIVSNSVTSCTSPASLPATVASLITNYWNGSGWTNGTPNINQNIVFTGNFTSLTGTAGDINGCSCQVNSGVKVVFNSDATLSIINAVNVSTNTGTSLTFMNNASLLQTNNVSNSGNIIYNRTTTAMNALDYTYWSSPVSGQTFNLLSPNSDPNKLYSYNNGWVAELATNIMTVGKGYLIRVPKAGTWPNGEIVSYPYSQPVSFTGIPNNGNITGQAITILDEPYLIGNPYPSAMDAKAFLTANNLILEGTLYLWTHNTPIADNGNLGFLYSANDYAVYNFTGGTATSAALNPGVNNSVPLGQIASGQSFFAKSIASSGTIVFNNNMRIAGNNAQFFKPAKEAKEALVEEGRIWLNLTNANGFFKQVLIGYVDGATNEYDNKYDGSKFDVEQMADLYSVISDKKFIIQGRALPFDVSDIVPLGYSSAIIGNYTIAIDHLDGLLINQEVYLEDKVTNTIHNLYNGGYTFATKEGVFEDRFVLRYTNKTLGTDEFDASKNLILVAVENKEIKISAYNQTIDKVFIYDMLGKLIYKKEAIESPKLIIENLKSSNQVLVVKVILDNKYVETKKVIY
ncbi:T9SS sorting signal type C domain-containing protein [Flavobacterium sp. ALJ2]|uniref:T9SS sorting signal type C domain-containing protein n=1 Tax=Flavobacterium sp. ALJ2 TaxID=2786960 RepID=UPI0018A03412|nr:T9SS sorting signal type C domain-containing protein [Flavobacterium sp. ALJ2]MBF7091006.1 T9SS sorting signal type C domain-containing protein [Flavobacterium sp. ALJ2]